jgi:hypothetical protein
VIRDTTQHKVHLVVAVVLITGWKASQPPQVIGRVPPASYGSIALGQDGPLPVPLDTIEDRPDPFLGRQIRVDAEVEEVLGPRVFTIDEPHWADFDNEVLVIVPSTLAPVIVREKDRITVTGRLQSTPGLAEELPPVDPNRQDELDDRPILIASRVVVHQRDGS